MEKKNWKKLKSTDSNSYHNLDFWEEVSGVLQDFFVYKKNNELIIELNQVIKIIIPPNKDFEKKLKESKGTEVSILRTDLPEKPFVLRNIKK